MKINSMFLTDFYKTIHHLAYVDKMDSLVSYWTPRMTRIEGVDKVVMFGLQATIKKYLIENFNENFFNRPKADVIKEYKRVIANTMTEQAANTDFLESLHDLGYLPIQIKAVAEGTRVNIKTPMFEIRNTVKGFGWVVNYLETLISCNVWLPMTSATKAYIYREIVNKYFYLTVSEKAIQKVEPKSEGGYSQILQSPEKLNTLRSGAVGDFSMRGMSSTEAAMSSSAAHLLSFTGTATIPSILWLEEYYNADCEKEIVGKGVPSTEHSVMSSYGRDGEFDCYKRLINEVFPKGVLSIVSDTYDYWNVLTNYLPKLKQDILSRDGKIVIRGDSGDPVDIICGEVLIYDLTRNNYLGSLEDCKKYLENNVIFDITGTLEYPSYITMTEKGEDKVEKFFKFQGKSYKAEINILWREINNNDGTSVYVIDGAKVVNCEEVEFTPAQKGTVEILWEIFGGFINEKGYKVLDNHIGAIYGDSITPERAFQIYDRLEKKGFAATNCTLGAGSYTYQYNTRDSLGFALKATHSVVNGEERQIFKEPKTDTGNFKKSQRGMCYVYREGNDILYKDGFTIDEVEKMDGNLLKVVLQDGELIKEYSLSDIRERLHQGKF